MGRPKKKNTDPQQSMEQLLKRAAALFVEPYDDRLGRDASLPSLRSVAEDLGTTILRTRKLLITAGYYSTATSRLVQEMAARGNTEAEIMEAAGLKHASVNSYLPYQNQAFNLDQTTVNADRHRLFRRRAKAVKELSAHAGLPDESLYLWKAIIAFEGYPFTTSGRGSRPGLTFKYRVSRTGGAGGKHYAGETVEEYGNEIWIEGKEKSVSRSTVERAYRNALALGGMVKGPRALNVPGAGSYLYPIFMRLGVIIPTRQSQKILSL